MSILRDEYKAFTNEPDRQGFILKQIVSGNTPTWVRHNWTSVISSDGVNKLELFFMPDALAIGPNSDPIYCPVYPSTLQAIADVLDAVILNTFLTNLAFKNATQKIVFQPEPLSGMTTVEEFLAHSNKVFKLVDQWKSLKQGHSKVVAIGPELSDKMLAIIGGYGGSHYGWAFQEYNSHAHLSTWLDYSQLGWLVAIKCILNGVITDIRDIFTNPKLCHLVTGDEGFYVPRYPNAGLPSGTGEKKIIPVTTVPGKTNPLARSAMSTNEALFWGGLIATAGFIANTYK
jgi:hypothetical protein